MSKFDERIQEIIDRKATYLQDQFYKEFDQFLNKWRLNSAVKFYGLHYYNRDKNKNDEYARVIFDKMVEIETDCFLEKIGRLNDYFT